MKKDIWRLWVCSTCNSETKLNYVADEKNYDRIKNCYCGGQLEYDKDLEQSEGV